MTQPGKILPQTQVAFAGSAVGKLNRTERGQLLLKADLVIADRIKYDEQDADRIWIGVSKPSFSPRKHRVMRCLISEAVLTEMEDAIVTQDTLTLAALALRLIIHFRNNDRECRFMLEDDS